MWVIGGVTILSFVVLLYVIELFDSLSGHDLDDNGIRPLETDGLRGIIFAPLLHSNWDHLIANTIPALILGFLMTLAGVSRFIYATAIVWIVGGFGTWLIGNLGAHCPYVGVRYETNHIGASGLIFGWLAFLLVFGFFTRKVWEIVVGVIVLFVYGRCCSGCYRARRACRGRATCAGRSPVCWRPTCCRDRNASNASCADGSLSHT